MAKQKKASKSKGYRNKMVPYKEGKIQQFSDLYLAPLARYRPEFFSRKDFVEELFGCFTGSELPPRTIIKCKALFPFKIRGRLWEDDGSKTYITESISVPKGTDVFVRRDAFLPEYKNRVDVELSYGQARPGQVFEITMLQWNAIKGSLVHASDYGQYK